MGSGSLWVVVPHVGSAVFNKKKLITRKKDLLLGKLEQKWEKF